MVVVVALTAPFVFHVFVSIVCAIYLTTATTIIVTIIAVSSPLLLCHSCGHSSDYLYRWSSFDGCLLWLIDQATTTATLFTMVALYLHARVTSATIIINPSSSLSTPPSSLSTHHHHHHQPIIIIVIIIIITIIINPSPSSSTHHHYHHHHHHYRLNL